MHEAIVNAVRDAGYQVLDAVQIRQDDSIEFRLVKNGRRGTVKIPPGSSAVAIAELLATLEARYAGG